MARDEEARMARPASVPARLDVELLRAILRVTGSVRLQEIIRELLGGSVARP